MQARCHWRLASTSPNSTLRGPLLGKDKILKAKDCEWEFLQHSKVQKDGLCGNNDARMMMLKSLRCSLREMNFVRFIFDADPDCLEEKILINLSVNV